MNKKELKKYLLETIKEILNGNEEKGKVVDSRLEYQYTGSHNPQGAIQREMNFKTIKLNDNSIFGEYEDDKYIIVVGIATVDSYKGEVQEITSIRYGYNYDRTSRVRGYAPSEVTSFQSVMGFRYDFERI